MKTFTKFALVAAMIFVGGASAMAQNALEDPRYGATDDERKTNLSKLNFLHDAYNAKNWKEASGHVADLMNDAPKAHSSIYIYGVTTYKNRAARATSLAEKKAMIDSVMLIYDRRVEHFGDHPTQGTAYILERKAADYLALNPTDGVGIRQAYKEAVEAAGSTVKPSLVQLYFQQLVNGYRNVELTAEELLEAYEQLEPLVESNGSPEDQDTFVGLFARSGAADCDVLEGIFAKQLAEKPGNADLLGKAYGLMTRVNCNSEFYISVAEQYYAVKPSSDVAIRLAIMFENSEQYDKALKYLNEMIETEADPAAKANLYVRVAASELGQKSFSATAQAARQAIALDGNNGLAHMLLAEAYIGGANSCGGFHGQTVFWLAYDELARAREADPSLQGAAQSRMNSIYGNFPTKEDAFMYIQGYTDGQSYRVNCGWVSGTTTTRSR